MNISKKSVTFMSNFIQHLIERRGGTGPMNLQQPDDRQGAKSRQAIRLEDKKERTTSSSYEEDVLV
ncbi:hypothetical protein GCM10022628_17110 [Anoxybacillus suryakundensis]